MGDKKFVLESKFVSADGGKLKVYAREGKSGINIGVSHKAADAPRAFVGLQEVLETKEAAETRFNERVAEAKAAGWTLKVASTATRMNAFSEMPKAAAAAPVKNGSPKNGPKPKLVKTDA
jgi:hypothetical protein